MFTALGFEISVKPPALLVFGQQSVELGFIPAAFQMELIQFKIQINQFRRAHGVVPLLLFKSV
jgi:hypothetical protein